MVKRLLVVLLVTGLFGGSAWAAIVTPTIENFSFELPGTNKIKGWNGENDLDIPGWQSDTAAVDSGVESDWPGSTEGTWSGFLMDGDPSAYNTTDYLIQAGDQFLLKVDARNNWSATPPAYLGITLYADTGSGRLVLATTTVELVEGAEGPWNTYLLQYTAPGVESESTILGLPIGVELVNATPTDDSWIGIDNVRFVPEPATIALLGLGALSLLRRRRA